MASVQTQRHKKTYTHCFKQTQVPTHTFIYVHYVVGFLDTNIYFLKRWVIYYKHTYTILPNRHILTNTIRKGD